jgi:hypothetical protein
LQFLIISRFFNDYRASKIFRKQIKLLALEVIHPSRRKIRTARVDLIRLSRLFSFDSSSNLIEESRCFPASNDPSGWGFWVRDFRCVLLNSVWVSTDYTHTEFNNTQRKSLTQNPQPDGSLLAGKHRDSSIKLDEESNENKRLKCNINASILKWQKKIGGKPD